MAEPMPLGSVAELQGLVIPLNAAAVSGAFVWLYSSIVQVLIVACAVATEPASEWFYLNDEGQQQGPYNVDEMALAAMEVTTLAHLPHAARARSKLLVWHYPHTEIIDCRHIGVEGRHV